MRGRIATTAAAVTIAVTAAPAAATTGPAGSEDAAGIQYQSEETSAIPVVPAELPPATTATEPASVPEPAPSPAAAPSVSEPPAETGSHTPATRPVADTDTAEAVPVADAQPVATASTTRTSLPFTGYDLVTVGVAGLALLGLGLVVRHAGRERKSR